MNTQAQELQAAVAAKSDKDITVVISSPDEDANFTFKKTTKVEDAIKVAVDKFGLSPKDQYDLALADEPAVKLDPQRPLVSYKIEDGTKLLLTSRGGGV